MATVEQRNNRFRLIFYYAGKRYTASLKTTDRREADAAAGTVERCLMHLQQGVLELPEGTDLVAFALSGGRREEKPKSPQIRTLVELRDRYLQAVGQGAMEGNSLYTVKIHLNHVITTLGANFPIHTLGLTHLQSHIERRTGKKGQKSRVVGSVTVRKEMASLGASWNWGVAAGLLTGKFPSKGLKYPKTTEKPPFQTWNEIERQVERGGLTDMEQKELWDSLYLTLAQIEEFLTFVSENARHAFLSPMLATAAHTGARRSELLRMRVSDLDFHAGTVLIREKKRVKGQRSTRRVPLSAALVIVLKEWLAIHPGGQALFCHGAEVERSKKRSRTTEMHQDQKIRSTTLQGRRAASVRDSAVAWGQASYRGRGPFPLPANAHGLEVGGLERLARPAPFVRELVRPPGGSSRKRLIDDWVGHTTEENARLYRHLHPSVQGAGHCLSIWERPVAPPSRSATARRGRSPSRRIARARCSASRRGRGPAGTTRARSSAPYQDTRQPVPSSNSRGSAAA